MSATDKDNANKPKEDDISALLDDDIDEHEHDHDNNDSTHLDAPVSDKKLGSPQVTKNDSPKLKDTTPKDDDDEEEDINIHSSSTAAAATVAPVAPLMTSAAPASPPPAPAQAQVPTQPATNPAQSEREARLAILTEAFPTVEKEVCEFVLESHRGDVEASINALLEISDPEFHAEPAPAPQPIRAPAPAPVHVPSSDAPPALPRRHTNELVSPMGNLNLDGQNQQASRDIDVRHRSYACHWVNCRKEEVRSE